MTLEASKDTPPASSTQHDSAVDSGDNRNGTEAAEEEAPTSCFERVFNKLLGYTWILPPAITLLIGALINYRVATVVSCVTACLSLAVGWIRLKSSWFGPKKENKYLIWPKTFDLVNPVAYTTLLPVALVLGEDFCRLWMGVIVSGIFAVISVVSVPFGRPLMADWISLGDDERLFPMMRDLRKELTVVLSGIFLVMFGSNLAVAIIGSEVGPTYVVLNFVVPYGTLLLGIRVMYRMGTSVWEKSARKHYGENWRDILFPQETEHEKGTEDNGMQQDVEA